MNNTLLSMAYLHPDLVRQTGVRGCRVAQEAYHIRKAYRVFVTMELTLRTVIVQVAVFSSIDGGNVYGYHKKSRIVQVAQYGLQQSQMIANGAK